MIIIHNNILKLILFIIILFFIFYSCTSQYNSIDSKSTTVTLYVYKERIEVEPPYNIKASDGEYLSYIKIEWINPGSYDRTYIYRADSSTNNYIKIYDEIGFYGNNSYIDKDVIPGKIYNYKLKNYSSSRGESVFSSIDSGYRAGSPEDIYEKNDTTTDAKEIIIGDLAGQYHSIYPLKDIDYVKFFAKENNYYLIEQIQTENPKNDIKNLIISIFDSNNNLLKISVGDNDYSKIKYFLCNKTDIYYIKIFSATITGDYKLRVIENNVIPEYINTIYATKGIFYNYIRLTWNNIENSEKYKIFRSDTYDGNFQQINIYLTKDCKEISTYTIKPICFDKDIIPGKIYYYKIKAYNRFGESDFSPIDSGYIIDLTTDYYEKNDSTTDAKIIELNKEQKHSIYPAYDVDYLKFYGSKNNYYILLMKEEGIMLEDFDIKIFNSENQPVVNYKSIISSSYEWYSEKDELFYILIKSKNNFIGNYSILIKYFSDYYYNLYK